MLSDLYALISRIDALLNAIDQAMTDISFTSAEIEVFIQRAQLWLNDLNIKIALYEKIAIAFAVAFALLFILVISCLVYLIRIEKQLRGYQINNGPE